jgi:Lon protease-like protein
MPLPLHIFEERYKIMIGECLQQKREFGVVYLKDSEICRIGCTAQIAGVLKRYEDGRMDIITKGIQRFNIHRTKEEKPYMEAEVSYFDDEIEKETEDIQKLVEVGLMHLKETDDLKGQEQDYSFLANLDLKQTSFFFSSNDDFTLEEKQKLLELTSTSERMIRSVELLGAAKERVKAVGYVKKVIQGNGDLKKAIRSRGRKE